MHRVAQAIAEYFIEIGGTGARTGCLLRGEGQGRYWRRHDYGQSQSPALQRIKLKAANGGSAPAEDTRRVEVLLDKGSPFSLNIAYLETAMAEGRIIRFDPAPAYEDHLKKQHPSRTDSAPFECAGGRREGIRWRVWPGD